MNRNRQLSYWLETTGSILVAALTLLCLLLFASCQNAADTPSVAEQLPLVIHHGKIKPVEEQRFKPMQIGVAYYPERRTEDQWHQDFKKMKTAGIKRIRIAEFAWSRIEANEGEFDWTWLDKSIEIAAEYDLKVVLCTPTATPPIWLIEKYPDILPVNLHGEQIKFGGRQHRCYNNKNYVDYSLKIVTELAKRYGKHPFVVAWQIDNEFGGEVKRCYCDLCKSAFQAYLKSEYRSIEELNTRWGNAFWSLDYQNFQQIHPPFIFKGELTVKNHPSLELEYSRFASKSIVAFSDKQAETIRKYTKDQLVTTNRFAYEWGDNLDSYKLSQTMDATGFDLYSTQLHQIAFYADINRSLNPENSWVLEYGTNSENLKEEMFLLQSRGVEWIYFFKFNPFPSGAEQSNESLLSITDEVTENYEVIKTWTSAMKSDEMIQLIPSGLGLYFDFESSWMHFFPAWGKYTERLLYQDYLINTVYKALFEKGLNAKIIFDPSDIDNVHSMILPLHLRYTGELENKLIEFIQLGGKVFITEDFFQKNNDNVYLTSLPLFYKEVLKIKDNNFLRKSESGQMLLMQITYGKGEVFVVNKSASVDDWKTILDQKLPTNPLTIL